MLTVFLMPAMFSLLFFRPITDTTSLKGRKHGYMYHFCLKFVTVHSYELPGLPLLTMHDSQSVVIEKRKQTEGFTLYNISCFNYAISCTWQAVKTSSENNARNEKTVDQYSLFVMLFWNCSLLISYLT